MLAVCATTEVPTQELVTDRKMPSSVISSARHTFHGLVEGAVDSQVGDLEKLEAALAVLLVEESLEPGVLLRVSDGAADLVAMLEELVGSVGAQQAVGSGDKDSGALGDCRVVERAHRGFSCGALRRDIQVIVEIRSNVCEQMNIARDTEAESLPTYLWRG